MKRTALFLVFIFFLLSCKQENEESLSLWYNEPAADWNDVLLVAKQRRICMTAVAG